MKRRFEKKSEAKAAGKSGFTGCIPEKIIIKRLPEIKNGCFDLLSEAEKRKFGIEILHSESIGPSGLYSVPSTSYTHTPCKTKMASHFSNREALTRTSGMPSDGLGFLFSKALDAPNSYPDHSDGWSATHSPKNSSPPASSSTHECEEDTSSSASSPLSFLSPECMPTPPPSPERKFVLSTNTPVRCERRISSSQYSPASPDFKHTSVLRTYSPVRYKNSPSSVYPLYFDDIRERKQGKSTTEEGDPRISGFRHEYKRPSSPSYSAAYLQMRPESKLPLAVFSSPASPKYEAISTESLHANIVHRPPSPAYSQVSSSPAYSTGSPEYEVISPESLCASPAYRPSSPDHSKVRPPSPAYSPRSPDYEPPSPESLHESTTHRPSSPACSELSPTNTLSSLENTSAESVHASAERGISSSTNLHHSLKPSLPTCSSASPENKPSTPTYSSSNPEELSRVLEYNPHYPSYFSVSVEYSPSLPLLSPASSPTIPYFRPTKSDHQIADELTS
ncbi:hypothetical protein Bhyg_06125 [Pseudolycoriella hygida]|uniref:Uncharacterized protein n=1 Tax=Pseudolycoriella hygida TaxID=35572 RepID=A0A9Q0S2M5_9DIPT|nr:hypothetical protein Bhyg_06125 [Pseudolycoriella hygida]